MLGGILRLSIGTAVARALAAIGQLLLAVWLTPTDFGYWAAATSIISVLTGMANFGEVNGYLSGQGGTFSQARRAILRVNAVLAGSGAIIAALYWLDGNVIVAALAAISALSIPLIGDAELMYSTGVKYKAYARVVGDAASSPLPRTLAFAAGYFTVWLGYSVLAALLQLAATRILARTGHVATPAPAGLLLIAAGAFHNDVVAVANGRVLFAHEQAFADRDGFYADLRRLLPEVEIVEVPAARVSLEDAIASYLFNAQLVTLPSGEMALVLPGEARATLSVWQWLEDHVAGNGPIRRLEVVDVRESMANGGGPACLRLRVVADPATVDPRFLVDHARLDRIAAVVGEYWPETIAPGDIADPALIAAIEAARAALLDVLDLPPHW